ncbi:hypothetical protein [Candidatus Acetatifactor stercoripullorum]|uniref:hypothetical protein n=1 Tax=Candidatus Acetatifactor stercoripullorum TaxID=2838414 RepID=UPI00298E1030|nr:hypothetical protein [Candidatus Acetatifactor stercoripullorum]
MNYVWEVVLSAKENGIEEEHLRYRQAREYSPYLEVSFYDLNTVSVEQNIIEVNPFYRFYQIFENILNINNQGCENTKALLLDAVFHYLAHTDLRMGMTKTEYYLGFLNKEMESGSFGTKAKKAIDLFSHYERKYIMLALLDVSRSGNQTAVFEKLFREIYGRSIIYVSRDVANELYIYVGEEQTKEEETRVEFLLDTFLPVGTQTEIFYLEHFGILDEEETMILDRLLLI